jgi:hypothetical protein
MEKNLSIANATSKYDQLKVDTDSKINQLNAKLSEADRNFSGATDAIKNIARERMAIEAKAEFLEKFLTYRNAPGDVSRKLFENYVCALWKNAEERTSPGRQQAAEHLCRANSGRIITRA